MNGTKYPRSWELINSRQDWERLKVPGGWIVHHSTRIAFGDKKEVNSECVVFVSDPNYDWNLE